MKIAFSLARCSITHSNYLPQYQFQTYTDFIKTKLDIVNKFLARIMLGVNVFCIVFHPSALLRFNAKDLKPATYHIFDPDIVQ